MQKYLKRTDLEIIRMISSCIAKVNPAKKHSRFSLSEKEAEATVELLCQRLELTERQAHFLLEVDSPRHLSKKLYTIEHPKASPTFIDLLQVKRQLLGNMSFPYFVFGLYFFILLLSGIGVIASGGFHSVYPTLFYCALWLIFLFGFLPIFLRNAKVHFLKPSTATSPTRTIDVKIQKVHLGRGFSLGSRGWARGSIPVYYVSLSGEIDGKRETLIYPLANEQVAYRAFNFWEVKRALQSLCKNKRHRMEISENGMVVDAGDAFKQRIKNIFKGYER